MSLEVLPGGAVLVDDLLLDCPPGLVTRLAFNGPPLTRVRTVLLSGADHDPGVAGMSDGEHRGATWTATAYPAGDGTAWLVESSTEGRLLHCPHGRPDVGGPFALTVPNPEIAAPGVRTNRRVLVTGGARSGKSALAERRLADRASVHYVATGRHDPDDPEWADRIARHRQRRPPAWRTVETLDVAGVLETSGVPALVDGLGTWTAGVLDDTGGWEGAPVGLHERQDQLCAAFAATDRTAVLVSDEVGDGVVPEHPSGRLFRDELGALTARLAAIADEVWRVTAGIGTRIR